jgi:hypothetical protein
LCNGILSRVKTFIENRFLYGCEPVLFNRRVSLSTPQSYAEKYTLRYSAVTSAVKSNQVNRKHSGENQ